MQAQDFSFRFYLSREPENESRLSVSVAVPAAGTYFVVLDNRAGESARAVTVTVQAARPPRPEPRERLPDTREPRT